MNNNKCKPLDKKKKQEKEAAKMLEPHKVEEIEQRPEVWLMDTLGEKGGDRLTWAKKKNYERNEKVSSKQGNCSAEV